MKTVINKWWIPVVTGLLLTASSFFIMSRPVGAFLGLAIFFGWIMTLNGFSNIVFSIQNKNNFDDWVWYLILGIFEVVLGAAMLFQPAISAEALILFTGFWLMFIAIGRISNAIMLKRFSFKLWWVSLISGIFIFIFSFLMLINPIFGMISVIYLTALPILISGVMMIFFGFQLKRLNNL